MKVIFLFVFLLFCCVNVFASKDVPFSVFPEQIPFVRLMANLKECRQQEIRLFGVFNFKSSEPSIFMDDFSYKNNLMINSIPIDASFAAELNVLDGKVVEIWGKCELAGKNKSQPVIVDVKSVRVESITVWEHGKLILPTD